MRKKPRVKKNIRITLAVFVLLFVILIGYLGYSVAEYGQRWFSMPYNPRIAAARDNVEAGAIYDRKDVKLAWTEDGVRKYASDASTRMAAAHTVGDIEGKTVGAETYFARYLYGYDKNVIDRLNLAVSGGSLSGSDVTLTIDAKLCRYIYKKMDYNGAVIVMNYTNGQVLASVSKPTFDPENIPPAEEDDGEGSEYVDRSKQGRYPPGSTMKIITASAAIEQGVDLEYTCTGAETIGGQTITCPQEGGHGRENLEEAFVHSCNTYFGMLSQKIGGRELEQYANKFLYNTEFNFPDCMLYSSQFKDSSDPGSVAWEGIGQHNDLTTPMHNAMIAAAVANGGTMPEPKLLLDVLHNGKSTYSFAAGALTKAVSEDTADILKAYMRKTVQNGTGTAASIGGHTVAGKTGTAEYSEDGKIKNHSWFVGFIDEKSHPLAVCVLLEGAGFGSAHAAPLAGDVLSYAIDLGY